MPVQVFAGSPILVEYEAAGVACVDVQIVLHTALFLARGLDQSQHGVAQGILFPRFRFHVSDDSQ